jgi:hypothetical protein
MDVPITDADERAKKPKRVRRSKRWDDAEIERQATPRPADLLAAIQLWYKYAPPSMKYLITARIVGQDKGRDNARGSDRGRG